MKCDMCGEVLAGASIICRKCNHNNAMKLVSNWRAKRSSVKKSVKKEDSTVPRHPISSTLELVESPKQSASPDLSEMPPWRAQVKEKVRQIREKRQAQEAEANLRENQLKEASLDPNPIVEAALSRIRRQSPSPSLPSPVRSTRRGPVAAALVEALTIDPLPQIAVKPRPQSVEKRLLKPVEQVSQASTLPSRTTPEPIKIPEKITPISRSRVPNPIPDRSPVIGWDVIPSPKPKPQPAKTTRDIPGGRVTQVIQIPSAVSKLTDDRPLPATLWLRTLAAICDYEIVAMAYLPIFGTFAMFNTSIGDSFFILFLLLSAIVILYQSISLLFADRTFGMALLNIHLVNQLDKKTPIKRWQKFLRAWGATIAFFIPPLNFLVMQSNKLKLSLPDLISGTSTVEE